jgi:hypothetical protein
MGLFASTFWCWRWKSRRSGSRFCTLEPGGMRTNWVWCAVRDATDLLPEYEPTVGSLLKMLRGPEARLEGDPRRISGA